jgi:hypothetical protein
MQGKKKTENVTSDTRVNVAITQHDSIFPNVHLPGGISSKATEYKELGRRGEKWESPIFRLGSAPTTTARVPTPQVIRKDHAVTQGGVRGPQEISGGAASTAPTTTSQVIGAAVNEPNRFRTEVDQAFGRADTGVTSASTGASTGAATGAATGATSTAAPTADGRTLLGAQNPVLRGDV